MRKALWPSLLRPRWASSLRSLKEPMQMNKLVAFYHSLNILPL